VLFEKASSRAEPELELEASPEVRLARLEISPSPLVDVPAASGMPKRESTLCNC
jgi:hypothetical protein